MNHNNYERIAFAMQVRDREFNMDLIDSIPRNQRLVDCMMDDYSDINFQDLGLIGLFKLFDFDSNNIASLKVEDLIELFRNDEDPGDSILLGEMIDHLGFSELFEASRIQGGLDTVNQVLKYACFNSLSLERVRTGDLNRIDPEELAKVGGNVYSIRFKVHDYDDDADEESCVLNYYSKELYITTDLNSLLNNGQHYVDQAVNELLTKSSIRDGLEHHITEIVIYFNGEPALHMECNINIAAINCSSLNVLKSLPEFDAVTNDKAFCEDIQKAVDSKEVSRKIKWRILENAIGM